MRILLVAFFSFAVFVLTAFDRPPSRLSDRAAGLMLPLPTDLILSGGDAYLAANLNFLRAATLPFNAPNSLESRAVLQKRVARLNAKHEDNYYVASGGLAWMGDVDSGQTVLAAAAKARYWDPLPYFFQGANEVYFRRDFLEGGRLVGLAAEVANEPNKTFFTDLSAKLYSRSEDLDVAIAYIKLLETGATSVQFKQMLALRVQRLVNLKALRAAALSYRESTGKPLVSLVELVHSGVLAALPEDPIGIGYELDADGTPILTREKP